VNVLAVDGSPTGSGRTGAVLAEVLAGAEELGTRTSVLSLAEADGDGELEAAVEAIAAADCFVFGSPVYRGSFATPLKRLLDVLPRGMWGETQAPITARAVAIVMTGATWHHYLGLQDLRNVLAGFFGAHVLTPGLYVPAEGFDAAKRPLEDVAAQARLQGRALAELGAAIAGGSALRAIRPQA